MMYRWLREDIVIAMHDEQLAEHGGSAGVRDEGLLLSALARPQNLTCYDDPNVFSLAAAYAFGIVRNHPFVDGNKRTAFVVCVLFLALNGWIFIGQESESFAAMVAFARGEISEEGFAAWLESQSQKKEPPCR